MTDQSVFAWKCHPEAEKALLDLLEEACHTNPAINSLREDLLHKTSTRLFDWLDHIVVGNSSQRVEEFERLGFVMESASPCYRVFSHPGAQLPSLVIQDYPDEVIGVAVKVECIADFLMVRGQKAVIMGTPFSSYRRCAVAVDGGVTLWVVERRGTRLMEPTIADGNYIQKYIEAKELWQSRPRSMDDEDQAAINMVQLAQQIVNSVGRDVAAWIVLEVERHLWQARNRAGQIQKGRQDELGMGWANHDHHTFRSSRRHFPALVRLFEILGFRCRERYFAGQEAGWGAQVMENAQAGLVLFLDVDLASEEVAVDFAHQPVPELPKYNTVGLWCALHGDSILKAGMHHLEAQFFFDELSKDLAMQDVEMMEPFSSFTYLKQAFTKGERWPVSPNRLRAILDSGKITNDQFDKFCREGALGSHLENLQRREGYKGFNQKNVSFIIAKTDPRTQHADAL